MSLLSHCFCRKKIIFRSLQSESAAAASSQQNILTECGQYGDSVLCRSEKRLPLNTQAVRTNLVGGQARDAEGHWGQEQSSTFIILAKHKPYVIHYCITSAPVRNFVIIYIKRCMMLWSNQWHHLVPTALVDKHILC